MSLQSDSNGQHQTANKKNQDLGEDVPIKFIKLAGDQNLPIQLGGAGHNGLALPNRQKPRLSAKSPGTLHCAAQKALSAGSDGAVRK